MPFSASYCVVWEAVLRVVYYPLERIETIYDFEQVRRSVSY